MRWWHDWRLVLGSLFAAVLLGVACPGAFAQTDLPLPATTDALPSADGEASIEPATEPAVDLGQTNRLLLIVNRVPASGLAMGEIPIPPNWRGQDGNGLGEFDASAELAGKDVPIRLIPPITDEASNWLVILKLAPAGRTR